MSLEFAFVAIILTVENIALVAYFAHDYARNPHDHN
ncbi:hypothetical protein Rrhod_4097 [Rhodococcus rhodnii LMG 5362]|uniref:Uncharacterized protein n=1 Tax=Rhodococcus rhodnii LMG 5362 TaxID=1273125 RepID=R7WHR7_9NOCA|nr:hypothetical protein Rrhod_4097 [Rhodococcus rhodnii LMG 5362]